MAQTVNKSSELEFAYKRIRDHTNELVIETAASQSEDIADHLLADQGHALRIVVGEGLIAIAKAIEKQR